jgi:diphthamide synthase (EF-2-diphthine--ammonia ligase)
VVADAEAVGLVTTVTAEYDRISMHGIRRNILNAQVARLGIPLHEATIPPTASNTVYEAAFIGALARARVAYPRARTVAFGDLFLDDVRSYRELFLPRHGWQPLFPLWGLNTAALAKRFVADGFHAIVCCVDTTQLAPELAGRDFDAAFLDTLPPGIDPCGERGEFHTCVTAGPIFGQGLLLDRGERVLREGRFEYCDLRLRAPPEDDVAASSRFE